jgi:hypothetical protein
MLNVYASERAVPKLRILLVCDACDMRTFCDCLDGKIQITSGP